LKEHVVTEDLEEFKTETDWVCSEDQRQSSNCSSSELVDKVEIGKSKLMETADCVADHLLFDGEYAQDVELMKSMNLPLSFTQASERRRRKRVCFV